MQYDKVNLFALEEINGFQRGAHPAFFNVGNVKSGVAICKDMDFAQFIRTYNEERPHVMFVPAWDFVQDDWLHSRMAILRGVENGYSIVRVARQGRITISDCHGRVLVEGVDSDGKAMAIEGIVPAGHHDTIYAASGEWFGVTNLIIAGVLIIATERKRKMLRISTT